MMQMEDVNISDVTIRGYENVTQKNLRCEDRRRKKMLQVQSIKKRIFAQKQFYPPTLSFTNAKTHNLLHPDPRKHLY